MRSKSIFWTILVAAALIGGFAFLKTGANPASAQTDKNFETENLGATVEYNARNEFALTQGGTTGVWNYGYTSSDASNNFIPYTANDTIASCNGGNFERWIYPPNNFDLTPQIARNTANTACTNIQPELLFIHPGPGGQRAVLRWTAPSTGTFQITGVFQKQNGNTTSDLKILKNAATAGEATLFTGSLGASFQQAFNFTATVAAGDKIDFSVGWGNGNYSNDGSLIAVTISQPVAACLTAPANLQVFVPAENSPIDVQSANTNASLVGDATYTNSGKIGRAFSFDGSGDHVRIQDNAAQKPANQLTIEGWFNLSSLTNQALPHLVSKPLRDNNFNSYALWYNGSLRIGYQPIGSGWIEHSTGYQPPLNVWNHYAFVLNTDDTGANANTMKLYVNGVEIFSAAANNPVFYNGINDALAPHPLLIGAELEVNDPRWGMQGMADEVSIYGRALSQTEIFDIVQQGSFGKCPPAPCTQAPNDLVSWFAGEQNALDSRSNNHGALQNGATFASGRVGQAFNFPTVNDFVSVADSPSLRPTNLTLEGWFNFSTAPSGVQVLASKNAAVGNSFVIYYDNGFLRGQTGDGSGTFGNPVSVAFTPTAGQWYYIAYTWQSGGNEVLYVNGVAVDTNPADVAPGYTNNPFTIGAGGGFSFQGRTDEVSLYSRALSASEISSVYNAGQSGKCKPIATNPPTNQVAWFTGDGDTRDFTSFNPAGTLQGNTSYRVGRVGQSFNFDGSGDYISTPDSANWDFGTGNFAIESWFNAPNPTGVQRIIAAGSQAEGANNVWALGYGDIGAWGGGQRLNFAVFNGSGYNDFSSNPVTFYPNTWHHAAVVRSGTSFTFYLDGVAIGTVPVGAGFAINGGTTGAIIGARYNQNPSSIFEFANGKLDEISVYKRGLTGTEIAAVYNAGVAGKLKSAATPVNLGRSAKSSASLAPTTVQLTDATVTFAQVTQAGTTSENGIDLGLLPPLPANVTFTGLAYDISTTATFTTASVCFNLPSITDSNQFLSLRVLHLEGANWINRTDSTTLNFTSRTICTSSLSTLSPFAIVQGLSPTAATVSVGGRVTNVEGGGIGRVRIKITDASGRSFTTTTNAFGYYRFDGIGVGETYVIRASSKMYQFSLPTRVLNVTEDVNDVDFTAYFGAFRSERLGKTSSDEQP